MEGALERVTAETTVSRLLEVACHEIVGLLDASRCTISRTIGDLIVELAIETRAGERPAPALFQLSDYPLTRLVLEQGEPRMVHRADANADPAEVAHLVELGYESLLLLPVEARGHSWGLVEVYANDRGFTADDAAVVSTVLERMGQLLPRLEGGDAAS